MTRTLLAPPEWHLKHTHAKKDYWLCGGDLPDEGDYIAAVYPSLEPERWADTEDAGDWYWQVSICAEDDDGYRYGWCGTAVEAKSRAVTALYEILYDDLAWWYEMEAAVKA